MKPYQWILFDADETLFRFDAFRGLQLMFSSMNVEFTQADFEAYQAVNKLLWVDYQNGAISAQELQQRRFDDWANKLDTSSQDLNSAFLAAMAEICHPLEGAVSLLNILKGKAKLGIITNGFTELQQVRLEKTGLKNFFEMVIISEQVGVAKPDRAIFEHALEKMGYPSRETVLMVGDNPDSDIVGGLNAGFDTCWLNVENKILPEGVTPHYQVTSLSELAKMFYAALEL